MKLRINRAGRDTAMKTASPIVGRRGNRRKKIFVKTPKTVNDDKTQPTDSCLSTRVRRKINVSELTGKITRDFLRLKCMVYGPKRPYLRDESSSPLPSPNPPSSIASPNSPSSTPSPNPLRSTPSPTLKDFDENDLGKVNLDSTDRTVKTKSPCESNDLVTGVSEHASKWAQACCHGGLRALLKEFPSIRKFIPNGITTDAFNNNSNKNRYLDVLCLDETRVILQGRAKENDYIHANWVILPSKRKYICTQAPLDETIEDFWLMVFQEKVPVIIMLCDMIEGGESKCSEYYPTAIGKELTFGNIKIKNIQKEKPIETIICFTLTIEMSNATHKLLHYKWAEWPDRAAPASASPVVELLRRTKPMFISGPVVVHCSAGIGRTGTYCAVDYAIDQLALGDTLCIAEIVKQIRKQRLHSVQTALQYLYLHNCLVEYLIVRKIIQRDANVKKLLRDYEKYLKKFNERNAKAKYIN